MGADFDYGPAEEVDDEVEGADMYGVDVEIAVEDGPGGLGYELQEVPPPFCLLDVVLNIFSTRCLIRQLDLTQYSQWSSVIDGSAHLA